MLKNAFFIFFTSFILLSGLTYISFSSVEKEESNTNSEEEISYAPVEPDKSYPLLILASSASVTIIYLFFFYYIRRNGETYRIVDKTLLKIIIIFCKELKIKENDIKYQISDLFSSYNTKQTKRLFNIYYNQSNDLKINASSLANSSKEAKEFLIYSLFNIASKDRLYSIEEEKLIEYIGAYIKFPKITYQWIKNLYLKNGLQEERKILEEENRKKLAESFLPYNAYKVLGVTPSVTKEQLKKVYRKLAKKYHPDKHHGKHEDTIQKAEDKFQEITKAYEIIKSYKNIS